MCFKNFHNYSIGIDQTANMATTTHNNTHDLTPSDEKTHHTAFSHPKVDPNTLEIDHVAEQKLVRKLDLMIVPPVMLLYLFSFLDRVNIGNARLYGLEEDLGMSGNQFQVAVSILFVTYILSELPSNLVIKKFTPSRWLAFLTTTWGLTATLTGVAQSYGGLIACRLVLGEVARPYWGSNNANRMIVHWKVGCFLV